MSFKQGDIVSFKNSNTSMQVLCDPCGEDFVICITHEAGRIHRREVPIQELIKALVH